MKVPENDMVLVLLFGCGQKLGGVQKIINDWVERIGNFEINTTLIIDGFENFDLIKNQIGKIKLIDGQRHFRHSIYMFIAYINFILNKKHVISVIHGDQIGVISFMSLVVLRIFSYKLNLVLHLEKLENLPDLFTVKHNLIYPSLWGASLRLKYYFVKLFFDKILCVSDGVKYSYERNIRFFKNKLLTVYHGVDVDKFKFSQEKRYEFREKLQLRNNDKILLFVGRISQQKRIDRVLGAFVRNFKNNENIYLFVLGDGKLFEKFCAKTSKYHNIKWFGGVPNVNDYMSMADYYINGSDSEGLSLSLLEALSSGLIPLCTNVSGISDLKRYFHCFYSLSNKNVFSLSKVIKEMNKQCMLPDYDKKIEMNNICNIYFNVKKNVDLSLREIGLLLE